MAGHEARRKSSAALFGNRYVVDVLLAIDRLTPTAEVFVTARMVASETALSDSLVRPVMLRLVDVGVLIALPRAGGPRSTRYYGARKGVLWEAISTACTVIANESARESDRR